MFIRTLRPAENWRILRKECQNKLADKKCMPGTLPWPEKNTTKEEKQKISKSIQTKPYKGWGGVWIYAKAPLEKGLGEKS